MPVRPDAPTHGAGRTAKTQTAPPDEEQSREEREHRDRRDRHSQRADGTKAGDRVHLREGEAEKYADDGPGRGHDRLSTLPERDPHGLGLSSTTASSSR